MESISCDSLWAVVVWYNPSIEEVRAIDWYKNDVKGVIIVDNSINDNSCLLSGLQGVTYIPQNENLGIAKALNVGCQEAIKRGAKWVLTMDQDSLWNQHSVREYIEEANLYSGIANVGIFSPYHDCDGRPETHHRYGRYEQKNVTMCSGNLLNLNAWKMVDGFRDDFFIDLVDDEICCHIRKLGLQVLVLNNILLTHKLGQGIKYSRILKHPYTPHNAWRYYYIARNIRLMMILYPEMKKYYKKQLFKYIKRICLYDNDSKWMKLRKFYNGWSSAADLLS